MSKRKHGYSSLGALLCVRHFVLSTCIPYNDFFKQTDKGNLLFPFYKQAYIYRELNDGWHRVDMQISAED